jgi:hypothetical protein
MRVLGCQNRGVLRNVQSWARRDSKSARRVLGGVIFVTLLLLGGDLLNGHLTGSGWAAIGIVLLALIADVYLWRLQRTETGSEAPGSSE